MGLHPFAYIMIGTFLMAVVTMLLGVAGLGKGQALKSAQSSEMGGASRSSKLMALRVGLCVLLLAEILIYVNFIKA